MWDWEVHLAVVGERLFFTRYLSDVAPSGEVLASKGSVMSVPIAGGTPSRVADVVGYESGLAATTEGVVFAENDSEAMGARGRVVLISPDGRRTLLTTTTGWSTIPLVSGDYVYFADDEGTKRVPLKRGATELLTQTGGALAVLDSNLIIGGDAGLYRLPLSGGPLTTLASADGGAEAPTPCGNAICWIGDDHELCDAGDLCLEGTPCEGTLMRTFLDGGTEPSLTTQGLCGLLQLEYDDGDFLMVAGGPAGPPAMSIVDGKGAYVGGPSNILGTGAFTLAGDCLYYGMEGVGIYAVSKRAAER
jgi:hypothetical protein